MKRNESYNTKQKQMILEAIKKEVCAFTPKDIYNKLKDKAGLTTIYREIERLVNDGYLNKFINENNQVYYQYHEKCV